jgi:hypothetical protein
MQSPSEEPTICPACNGHGRVRGTGRVCTACWMSGVVPAWRARQLLKNLAVRRSESVVGGDGAQTE